LKKFFVLPALPSNNKNSFDHHNSYNKGPNLAQVLEKKVIYKFGSGYSHGAPNSDICHIDKLSEEPLIGWAK
jgi:hypothetical protein